MSPATIDRYLKPVRDKDPLPGKSATKPGSLLRNSITVPKAGDELDDEPGFFEIDTLAHCGPTLNGEFARCVNDTDMHTGWVYTHPMKNNASTHVVDACTQLVNTVPYLVTGLDFDNGSEFINHNLIDWAADRKIFFTRARPDTKNDQATIESKNNHLVRRYGFSYRYDTATELELLQRLWPLVNDRLNFFTPRKKPTGYSTDRVGRPQTRLRLCQDTVSTIAGFRDPQRPAETRASEVPGRSGSGRPGCRDRSDPATVDQARRDQDREA
ncbi:transposase family protein [Auritidibacter ignavus]|uniref:Transposase family protein n=1 Tax=Auritidibacter ignavus TaxID=678932 RepID=A0AAJ6DCL6_9MICC|nr:transposase family protein [Auritidibacter ignavus]WGH93780.1 transposase family protein [Auritidibacter ignavus]